MTRRQWVPKQRISFFGYMPGAKHDEDSPDYQLVYINHGDQAGRVECYEMIEGKIGQLLFVHQLPPELRLCLYVDPEQEAQEHEDFKRWLAQVVANDNNKRIAGEEL